jgi:DNA-binding YbaB/EbfC family protein
MKIMSRRPNFGGMGMGMNMQQMMKQAKKLQAQMEQEQNNINQQEFTGTAADEMVTAVFAGNRQLKSLKIKPEAIDPDDPDMLQDLIIDAVNKGLTAIDEATKASLGKYTQGLN